jgi:tetratricopeptide (TPR) repeat protein
MDTLSANPLFRLWREVAEAGGDLDAAVERLHAPGLVAELTEPHLAGLLHALSHTDFGEDAWPLAWLTFEAAARATHLPTSARRDPMLALATSLPDRHVGALGVRARVLEAALALTDREREPAGWAWLANGLGGCLAQLAQARPAMELLEGSVRVYRELAERDPEAFRPDVATTLDNLGKVLTDVGERAGAQAALEEALEIRRALAEGEPGAFLPDVAETLRNLGRALSSLGDRAGARTACEEALGIRRALAEREPEASRYDVAAALHGLANVLSDLGDRAAARIAYEEALAVYRALAEREPQALWPPLASVLNDLGNVRTGLGDRVGGRAAYEEGALIFRALAEREPQAFRPYVAITLSNLANVLGDLGDRGGARTAFEEALVVFRALAELEPKAFESHVARTLSNLGSMMRDLGDRAGARRAYEEALHILEAGSIDRARWAGNLAALLWEDGLRDEALGHARAAVEGLERALRAAHSAGARYSFKNECLPAYLVHLADGDLRRDTWGLLRAVEGLRQGELLAGESQDGDSSSPAPGPMGPGPGHDDAEAAAALLAEGPEGLLHQCPAARGAAYLTIQRTVDGTLFLVLDEDGVRSLGVSGEWEEAADSMLFVLVAAPSLASMLPELVLSRGRDLWEALPDAAKKLFESDLPILVSPDDLTANVPLELLTPTGDAKDCLGLRRVLARTPGVARFARAVGPASIGASGAPSAAVFANPRHRTWHGSGVPSVAVEGATYATHLSGSEKEAEQLEAGLRDKGFALTPDGAPQLRDDATLARFLSALDDQPWIVHFTGHGGCADGEPYLCFADTGMLPARGLAGRWLSGNPMVMLNCCMAGRTEATGGSYRGLTDGFLSRGASVVVASSFPVADFPSQRFGWHFYDRLLAGDTVGEAILEARRAVAAEPDSHPLYWVLFAAWGNPNARLSV